VIDRDQLGDLIRRVLAGLRLDSEAAVRLLLGTAAQESGLGKYLRQLGGGPALGIFQMEPATERDIWVNYLSYRSHIAQLIYTVTGRKGPGPWLEWDLAYQIAMCRILFLRVPEPLPNVDDLEGMARYYKKFYNTMKGKGAESEFIKNCRLYGV